LIDPSAIVAVIAIKQNSSCFLIYSKPYAGGFLFFLDKKKKQKKSRQKGLHPLFAMQL